jgi:hypothetical protein
MWMISLEPQRVKQCLLLFIAKKLITIYQMSRGSEKKDFKGLCLLRYPPLQGLFDSL